VDNYYGKGAYDRSVKAGVMPEWNAKLQVPVINWGLVTRNEARIQGAPRPMTEEEKKRWGVTGNYGIENNRPFLIPQPAETPEQRRQAEAKIPAERREAAETPEERIKLAALVSAQTLSQLETWAMDEGIEPPDKNDSPTVYNKKMAEWKEYLARPDIKSYAEAAVKAKYGIPILPKDTWNSIPKAERATAEQIQWAADLMRWPDLTDCPPEYFEMAETILEGRNPYVPKSKPGAFTPPPVSPPPLPSAPAAPQAASQTTAPQSTAQTTPAEPAPLSPIEVEVPGFGTIEFPAGMTQQEIRAVLSKASGQCLNRSCISLGVFRY